MTPTPPPALQRALLDPETLGAADSGAVLGAFLGGAVRARLPDGHPLRAPLRAQQLGLAQRHARIGAELAPLLEVWAEAGLPALLTKGFALAEWEYPAPGMRFYGDVDVLLPDDPAALVRGVHLAMAHGWRSDGLHASPELWTHEVAHLYSPGGDVRLDVHRYLVAGLPRGRTRALTKGAWVRSRPASLRGAAVRLLSPPDAAVLGLALARSVGDLRGLKPADFLDLQVLAARHGLSPAALDAHARALGVGPVWASFLALCDPWGGRAELNHARSAPVLAAGRRAAGLFPYRGERLRTLWRVLPALIETFPDLVAAWAATRRGGDPRAHLRRWTPGGPTRRLPGRALIDRLTAVRWWTRLLYPRQSRRGVCVPRAYASYRALRRAGHPALFVTGVSRAGVALPGHAWIEDDRGELEAYGEPFNRQAFKELFRFPAGGGRGV